MATKPAKPTITLKRLAADLAEEHALTTKQADAILADTVELVVKHLKKGDRIRIGGLGILQVRERASRVGRNPATGEAIKIKASKKVAFRAAQELKTAVGGPAAGRLVDPFPGSGFGWPKTAASLPGDPTTGHPKPKPKPK